MFRPALAAEVAGSLGAWQRWRPTSAAGVIVACGHKAAPTRWRTLTVAVSGTTLAIEPDDGETPGAC